MDDDGIPQIFGSFVGQVGGYQHLPFRSRTCTMKLIRKGVVKVLIQEMHYHIYALRRMVIHHCSGNTWLIKKED
jgi:hypothetical protein